MNVCKEMLVFTLKYVVVELENIGCYIDTGVRDLEGPYITTADMTPEKCVRWCNNQEYSYAGLQVKI